MMRKMISTMARAGRSHGVSLEFRVESLESVGSLEFQVVSRLAVSQSRSQKTE